MANNKFDAKILKGAGNIMYVNGYCEDSIQYYEESIKLNDKDYEAELYMGIAYYKVGKDKKNENYIKRAIFPLNKATKNKEIEGRAHYYLALSYSFIGDSDKAINSFELFSKSEYADTDAVINELDSYIAQKTKDSEKMKDIYSYFDDPMLLDIYNILYKYLKNTSISNKLNKKYNLGEERAIAYELNKIYTEIFEMDTKSTPLVKYVKIILKLIRGRDSQKNIKLLNKKGITKQFIETLPIFTKAVIDDFVKKFGGGNEIKDIPYLVMLSFKQIKSLVELYNELETGIIQKDKILKMLIKINRKMKDIEIKDMIRKLKTTNVYRIELREIVARAIKINFKLLHERISLFYEKQDIKKVIKLLISDLSLKESDKIELFLME